MLPFTVEVFNHVIGVAEARLHLKPIPYPPWAKEATQENEAEEAPAAAAAETVPPAAAAPAAAAAAAEAAPVEPPAKEEEAAAAAKVEPAGGGGGAPAGAIADEAAEVKDEAASAAEPAVAEPAAVEPAAVEPAAVEATTAATEEEPVAPLSSAPAGGAPAGVICDTTASYAGESVDAGSLAGEQPHITSLTATATKPRSRQPHHLRTICNSHSHSHSRLHSHHSTLARVQVGDRLGTRATSETEARPRGPARPASHCLAPARPPPSRFHHPLYSRRRDIE